MPKLNKKQKLKIKLENDREIDKAYLEIETYCRETGYTAPDKEKFLGILNRKFDYYIVKYVDIYLNQWGFLYLYFDHELLDECINENVEKVKYEDYWRYKSFEYQREGRVRFTFDAKNNKCPERNDFIPINPEVKQFIIDREKNGSSQTYVDFMNEKMKKKSDNEIRFNKMVVGDNLVIPIKNIKMKLFAKNTITIDYKG